MIHRRMFTVILAMLAALTVSADAWAQEEPPQSLAVEDNARGGAVRARAPGRMVSAGLARAALAQDRLLSRPEITQSLADRPLTAWQRARVEHMQTLFTTIQQMIVAFHNVIRAQGGRPPIVVPPPSFPDVEGGGGGDLPDLPDLPDGFDFGDLLEGLRE